MHNPLSFFGYELVIATNQMIFNNVYDLIFKFQLIYSFTGTGNESLSKNNPKGSNNLKTNIYPHLFNLMIY